MPKHLQTTFLLLTLCISMARRCTVSRATRSLLAVLGAAAALAASADQEVSLSPDIGYQCQDGTQWHVLYCRDEQDDAACAVLQLDQPLRNGFQVRTNELRGDVIRRLQGCEARHAVFDEGMVSLAGPVTAVAAKPAAPVRDATVADAGRNANENSDWGEVEYIGNTNWIRRIGNMEVEYIGNTDWIRRIGNMDVEYLGNTEWIRRIGNLEVEYIGNTNWIRRIGNMNVEYIGNTEWISYIGNR